MGGHREACERLGSVGHRPVRGTQVTRVLWRAPARSALDRNLTNCARNRPSQPCVSQRCCSKSPTKPIDPNATQLMAFASGPRYRGSLLCLPAIRLRSRPAGRHPPPRATADNPAPRFDPPVAETARRFTDPLSPHLNPGDERRRGGVRLHAGIIAPAGHTRRLERLCRYALRPPVAEDWLQVTPDQQVVLRLRHRWSDGTTHVVFEPTASWAGLMRRAFGFDVLACPRCEHGMRLIAVIEQPEVLRRILRHLGHPLEVPPPAPARAPLFSDDAGGASWALRLPFADEAGRVPAEEEPC